MQTCSIVCPCDFSKVVAMHLLYLFSFQYKRCDSLRGKWILGMVTFYLCKCACHNALYARVLNYVTQLHKKTFC